MAFRLVVNASVMAKVSPPCARVACSSRSAGSCARSRASSAAPAAPSAARTSMRDRRPLVPSHAWACAMSVSSTASSPGPASLIRPMSAARCRTPSTATSKPLLIASPSWSAVAALMTTAPGSVNQRRNPSTPSVAGSGAAATRRPPASSAAANGSTPISCIVRSPTATYPTTSGANRSGEPAPACVRSCGYSRSSIPRGPPVI
jgi:hypothetical protein